MNKLRKGLFIFAIIIIIAQLATMNYTNLSWAENKGNYLGIFSMICVILSVVLSKEDS